MRPGKLAITIASISIVLLVAIVLIHAIAFERLSEIAIGEVVTESLVAAAAFAIALFATGLSQRNLDTALLVAGAECFYFGSILDLLDKVYIGPAYFGVVEDGAGFLGFLLLCWGFNLFLRQQRALLREVEATKDRLAELSITDGLTGLYNSRHFYDRLAEEVTRSHRYGRTFSVLLFDIDNFKRHNDEFGHLSGDKVLKRLGKTVRLILRDHDSGYRYGGEEFTVILPETDVDQASIVAERLRMRFSEERFENGVSKTISIGVSEYTSGEESSSLVKRADEAMYAAKRAGKNRVESYSTG